MSLTDGTDPLFLRGIEEFNAGRYFDAHETWEELWHRLEGADRIFVQALIQASVALHHFERGNNAGAWHLAQATLSKLAVFSEVRWGIACGAFAEEFADHFAGLLAVAERDAREAVRPPAADPPRIQRAGTPPAD